MLAILSFKFNSAAALNSDRQQAGSYGLVLRHSQRAGAYELVLPQQSILLADAVLAELVGHGGVGHAEPLAQEAAAGMALIQLLQDRLFESADDAVQIALQ